jgi:DNA-binding winged helix-turn-helix (wHTH) protein/Tol biopolymer transport system component
MNDTVVYPTYAFEGFRLDVQHRVLSRATGEAIPLAPKVFDTLLYFVERPGHLITKRALLEAIWPHVIVEENNLNQVISALRRVLGETVGQHRFIATAPGQGYRFVAEVRVVSAADEATPQPAAAEVATVAGRVQETASSRRLAAAVLAAVTLTAIGVWLIEREIAPSVALPVTRFVVTPPATAPLANLGGLDVIISPDGQRLAYFVQHPQTGSVALYMRELASLEAIRLAGTEIALGNNDFSNMNPFFSSDGQWIGFRAPNRGIMRVALDGGPPIKIVDDHLLDHLQFRGAASATDGTIIYSSGQRLYRISAAGGGTPETLTPEASDPTLLVAAPALLPGERAVLFGVNEGGNKRIAVLDLTTRQQKIVIENGQNPVYTSTGHVVFARGTTLMAARFDLAERAVTSDPFPLLEGVRNPAPVAAADYAVSANGTLVYVPESEESVTARAIVWVDRKGNVIERAVSELVPNARDPRLSPDGSRLALTLGPMNDGDVWSYDLGGRPPIPLAVAGNNSSPVFNSDSSQVAFIRYSATASKTYVTRADGGLLNPQPMRAETIRGLGAPADWAQHDELVMLGVHGCCLDIIATQAAAAGEIRDIVATEGIEFDPALSPNGRWLAYVTDRTGQSEIWVARYPEGVPVRVSSRGGYEPRWSVDGRELFYLQDNFMMAVTVETEDEFSFGTPAPLFDGPYFNTPSGGERSYDVARDGRFLMIQPGDAAGAAAAQTSMVVVQNWTGELKRLVPTE